MTPLQFLILKAIVKLGSDAHGWAVWCAVEPNRFYRYVCILGFLSNLIDLEEQGFICSWLEPDTSDRRKRSKRYFRVQDLGLEALGISPIL